MVKALFRRLTLLSARPRVRLGVAAAIVILGATGYFIGPHVWASYHVRAGQRDLDRHRPRAAYSHLERALRVWPESATTQRLASFHGQVRAEIYFTCDELDAGLEAMRDADANGLLDLCWLDRSPVLEVIRGHRDFEPIRRSTALRAARIVDILDG